MDDHKFDLRDGDLVNLLKRSMKSKIIAVDLKTLDRKLQCAICIAHIKDDEKII